MAFSSIQLPTLECLMFARVLTSNELCCLFYSCHLFNIHQRTVGVALTRLMCGILCVSSRLGEQTLCCRAL